ncbi:MAG TPA: transposase [Acidobacteriaceae bacterium]|nr:transposase [Acidobacteriaceae bacterium]
MINNGRRRNQCCGARTTAAVLGMTPLYRKRWKLERLFAWMHNFRRLVTRWEYHIENFIGFVYVACLQMLHRKIA